MQHSGSKLLWFILLELQSVLCHVTMRQPSTCPDNVTMAVWVCLSNTTRIGSSIGSNYYAISNSCRNGVYSSAVTCVEQLITDCADDHIRRLFLRAFISVSSMERSFQLLCSHLELYKEHSQCMQAQNETIKECENGEHQLLDTRLQSESNDPNGAMLNVCRYHVGIRSCSVELLRKACGEEIGEFQSQVVSGMMPPICEGLLPVDSDGCASFCMQHSPFFVLCLLFSIIIVKIRH